VVVLIRQTELEYFFANRLLPEVSVFDLKGIVPSCNLVQLPVETPDQAWHMRARDALSRQTLQNFLNRPPNENNPASGRENRDQPPKGG
jgi:hypothetical protein